MEKIERVYEKGPGFLRDVFQYIFPGVLFLSFIIVLLWFLIVPSPLKEDLICFLKNSPSILFVIFIFLLIFGYLMGVLFMELGDLLNCFIKCGFQKETFKEEMQIAINSPIILSYYIERYNLLFYTKRNIGICFLLLSIFSFSFYKFLRLDSNLIYAGVGAAILGILFIFLARRAYKDFTKRINAALTVLEQRNKK